MITRVLILFSLYLIGPGALESRASCQIFTQEIAAPSAWDLAMDQLIEEQDAAKEKLRRERALDEIGRVAYFKKHRNTAALTQEADRHRLSLDLGVSDRLSSLLEEIVAIRLTGEDAPQEIAKAEKRVELIERLKIEIKEDERARIDFSKVEFYREELRRNLRDILGLLELVAKASDSIERGDVAARLIRLLSRFNEWFFEVPTFELSGVEFETILMNREFQIYFERVLQFEGEVPDSVLFRTRGTLALVLDHLRQDPSFAVPEKIVLPFKILNKMGRLQQGFEEAKLDEFEAGFFSDRYGCSDAVCDVEFYFELVSGKSSK